MLKISDDGRVFLKGQEIKRVKSIEIKNINPVDPMEVVLHISVREVDIQYRAVREEARP